MTTLEEAMSAFNDLTQVVDDLIPFGLAADPAQMLKNSISTAHAYVQHNFIHNIAMESDVAHHCVTLGGHHVLWILELRNESCDSSLLRWMTFSQKDDLSLVTHLTTKESKAHDDHFSFVRHSRRGLLIKLQETTQFSVHLL